MSLDFNCYVSTMPDFSATDFDRFTSDHHFQVHMDPKIHLRDYAGFLPVSIRTVFLSATVQDCLSGFELYVTKMAS